MIGSIIGDIVGSVYEFTTHNIKTKEFELFSPVGSYTDDSIGACGYDGKTEMWQGRGSHRDRETL